METQTPNSIIKHQLRLLWLRSRERNEALKKSKYSCERCGKKKSQKKSFEQKIEVHHKEGICNWNKIITTIREELLCSQDKLEALCKNCHERI